MTPKESTSPSILVVGATGQLGTRLVRQLAAAGTRPYALVRNPNKAARLQELATSVIGDLTQPKTLEEPFAHAERVFIAAPPVPEMETIERNAIEAAVAAAPSASSISRTSLREKAVRCARCIFTASTSG